METEIPVNIKSVLDEVLKITGAKPTTNGCYESKTLYFIFIGWFPVCHVNVCNKAGTDCLFMMNDLKYIGLLKKDD